MAVRGPEDSSYTNFYEQQFSEAVDDDDDDDAAADDADVIRPDRTT